MLTLVVYYCSNLVDFRLPFWRNISSVVVGKGGRDEGKLIFRSFILNCAAGRLRRLDKVQLIGELARTLSGGLYLKEGLSGRREGI